MPNLLQNIMYLINKIKWQSKLIEKLSDYIDWLEDDSDRPRKNTDITKLDYKILEIDDAPKVVQLDPLDYRQLLHEATEAGKPIKKVCRRKESAQVLEHIHCPKCQAPHAYLYKNNGKNNHSICVKFVRRCLARKTALKKILF